MSVYEWIEAAFITVRAASMDKVIRIPWTIENGLWSAEIIVEWSSIIINPFAYVWIINAIISFADGW